MTQQPDYNAEKAALIAELNQAGIKHNPEKIIRIAKLADGKIVFLEEGDDRHGLQHILAKADQFAKVGIDQDEIPDAVIQAAVTGTIVGYQGKSHDIAFPSLLRYKFICVHLRPSSSICG